MHTLWWVEDGRDGSPRVWNEIIERIMNEDVKIEIEDIVGQDKEDIFMFCF